MTPDEIRAKRERHKNDGDGCCETCMDTYPCDVIQVLNAWENHTSIQPCPLCCKALTVHANGGIKTPLLTARINLR